MGGFFEKLKKGMGIEVEEKPEEEILVKKESEKEEWSQTEGELAIDMWETDSELIIQSAIAGVEPEDLNIELEGEMLIIEGERKRPKEPEGEPLIQECYWGKFSRKLILPLEINPDKIEAKLKNGILTIKCKKIGKEKKKKISVISE